jgi:hypothetical protein
MQNIETTTKKATLPKKPLDSILKGFHAGTTYVEERRFLASFAEFRRLSREKPTGK